MSTWKDLDFSILDVDRQACIGLIAGTVYNSTLEESNKEIGLLIYTLLEKHIKSNIS